MAVRLFFEDAGKQAQFSKIDFAAMKSEVGAKYCCLHRLPKGRLHHLFQDNTSSVCVACACFPDRSDQGRL